MEMNAEPRTEQELIERCQSLSGKTLSELAKMAEIRLPNSLTHAKGFMGQLIEWYLGVNQQNLPAPDFVHLGIELKTIPINEKGEPQESTYVCTAPISLKTTIETWETSRVREKLAHVLWVPIEGSATIPIEDRRIGNPLLWHLPKELEIILKKDWEELTEMLLMGQADKLSARFGTYLHIRPKARNASVLQEIINADGESVLTTPKGFYLRTQFTKKILNSNYFKS